MVKVKHNSQQIRNVAIYLRISRDNDRAKNGDFSESLREHTMKLKGMAELGNYSYQIYNDGVMSGMEKVKPELNRMVSDIKENKFDAVLVHDIDRLGRGAGGLNTFADEIENYCPLIITPVAEYNLKDGNSRTLFGIGSVIAEAEYRQIRKRLTMGKLAGARMGKYQFAILPYGYTKDKEGRLIPDEHESKVYRYIIELMLSGLPYGAVCNKLTAEGIYRRNGNKLSPHSINRMVHNEVYRGIISYSCEFGEVVVHEAHQPLISNHEYTIISEMVNKRTPTHNKTRSKSSYITNSLYHCASCGKRMVINSTKRHTQRNGQRTGEWYQADIVKTCRYGCKSVGTMLPVLEKAIIERIKAYSLEIKEELSQLKLKNNEQIKEQYNSKIKEVKKDINGLANKKNNLISLFVDGLIDRDQFTDRQDKFDVQLKHLETIMSSHKEGLECLDTTTQEQRLNNILKNIDTLRDTKSIREDTTLTDEQKKEQITLCNHFLKNTIAKIIYERPDKAQSATISIEWM